MAGTFPTVLGMWCVGCLAASCSLAANAADEDKERSVIASALAGPMEDVTEVVFAVRLPYDDPHWYANIGYFCDDERQMAYAGNGRPDVGKLCKVNIRTGDVTTLVDDPGGSIRDPQVHYDGRKVLFAYRRSGTDCYHLYEVGVDGSGLRQITGGAHDDYEPCYLPDGGIAFVSTRCNCWVNCWKTQVGVIYRCDADGGNIRRLSYSGEHDNTPWVLPDGRVLYTRWEYVDRSQVEFHHLWTMNPDGTAQAILFGNMHPGIVMIDAKPIPGSRDILAGFSPGHGMTDHRGTATIVSPAGGPDDRSSARPIPGWPHVEDPYALSDDCFLAAQAKQILVGDAAGNRAVLYRWQGEGHVREPRPVLARAREPVIPSRVDWTEPTGRLILSDIYASRHMAGVARGEIKKLLLLEILPKPVNFSGGPDLVSWRGTFTLERVLGTVPVEEDGSANFELPACRPVFFVALDKDDMSVKRMHSFTTVMPGETVGCVGCHEPRTRTPAMHAATDLQALRRPPSRIEPFAGVPEVIDFTRDIQPILDRHCVECHQYDRPEGQVLLTGDLGYEWSHSFFSLFAHLQVADGRNGLGNHAPRTIGSSASPLLAKLDERHYGVRVSPDEWRTVWLWIESGAAYAGSYAGLRNAEDQAVAYGAPARVFQDVADVLRRRCSECHTVGGSRDEQGIRPLPFDPKMENNSRKASRPTGWFERVVFADDPVTRYSSHILLNFSRPALSPLLLGPLDKEVGGYGSCGAVFSSTDDPDYRRLLVSIEAAKTRLDVKPRYGTPGFLPNRQYVREMTRYGILPPAFDLTRDAINVFETDETYWRTFWHGPPEAARGITRTESDETRWTGN